MKFNILPYGDSTGEIPLYSITIDNKLWLEWYKENARRFGAMGILDSEDKKQEFMKDYPIFDIDESEALGLVSLDHLNAMSLFFKKKLGN